MAFTVAIAGSSGLIGSALVTALRTADQQVLRIVRRTPANASELHWDPDSGELDAGALTGAIQARRLPFPLIPRCSPA